MVKDIRVNFVHQGIGALTETNVSCHLSYLDCDNHDISTDGSVKHETLVTIYLNNYY